MYKRPKTSTHNYQAVLAHLHLLPSAGHLKLVFHPILSNSSFNLTDIVPLQNHLQLSRNLSVYSSTYPSTMHFSKMMIFTALVAASSVLAAPATYDYDSEYEARSEEPVYNLI